MYSVIKSDFVRGNASTFILRCLAEGDCYGYEIRRSIEERSGGQFVIKEPTLYSCLKRLEEQGFISSYWGEVSRGGRRRYYTLTEMGRNVFLQSQTEWEYQRTIGDRLISDRQVELESIPIQSTPARRSSARSARTAPASPEPVVFGEQLEIAATTIEPEPGEIADAQPPASDLIVDQVTDQVQPIIESTENAPDSSSPDTPPALADQSEVLTDIADNHQPTDLVLPPDSALPPIVDQTPADPDQPVADPAELFAAQLRSAQNAQTSYLHALAQTTYSPPDTAPATTIVSQFDTFAPEPEPAEIDQEAQLQPALEPVAQSAQTPVATEATPPPAPEPVPAPAVVTYTNDNTIAANYRAILREMIPSLTRTASATASAPKAPPAQPQAPEPVVAVSAPQPVPSPPVRQVQSANIQIRLHDKSASRKYAAKYTYYADKLMLRHYAILFVLMLFEISAVYLVVKVVSNLHQPNDGLYYLLALMGAIAFPAYAFVINMRNPNRPPSPINFNFNSSMIFRTLLLGYALLMIYLLNVMLCGVDLSLSNASDAMTTLALPTVLAVNIPLSTIIFNMLYCTHHFSPEA